MKWTVRSLIAAGLEALFGEGEEKKMNATAAVRAMQETLSARADLAAFKQQGAEDLEGDLRAELARNQQLEAEAAQLLTQGRDADAQVRMAQKIASDEALARLMERLTSARSEAEVATSTFALEQQRVKQRETELPSVLADEAYLKRQREIQDKIAKGGGSGGAVNAFDAHARSVRTEIGAADKRDRLLSGGVDATREIGIQTTLNTTRLQSAMADLRERVGAGEVAGVLPKTRDESAADRAKRLLNPGDQTIPTDRRIGG